MGTVLLLATEAAHHQKGFGINLDIFEANLINLIIVIGVLFYFGRGFVGNILNERRSGIEQAIKEAEQRQKDAAAALADQQQKLTQAQTEAEHILAQAETTAKAAKETILAQATLDVERMKADSGREVETERQKVIGELRGVIAARALQKVESQLAGGLSEESQHQLIDRSIALIGG